MSTLPPGISSSRTSRSKPKRPSGMSNNPRSTNSNDLRDPTVHELHNGPERSQLPETVRNNARSETVCKFCGVSYLVFSEIKELEKKITQAEEQLNEYRKKAKKFDTLQQKVHQLVAMEKQHQEEHAKLQRRSATLEACIYEREEALDRAHKETHQLTSKMSGVRSALQRERANINNLKIKTVRTLGDMATLMKSTQHEISVVGTRLKREEDLRHNAEQELHQATLLLDKEKALNEQQQQNIQELQTAMEELEQQWHREVEQLKTQQQQQLQTVRAKHDTLTTEMQDKCNRQQEELKQMQEELKQMQLRCRTAEQKTKQAQEISKEHQCKITALEQELDNVRNASNSSSNELSKTLEELRRQHERLKMIHKMDKAKLVEEVQELTTTNQQLQQQLLAQENNVQTLKDQKDAVEQHNVDLQTQLQKALDTLQQLQRSMGSTSSEQEEQMQRMKQQHLLELKALNDRINGLVNELSDANSNNEKNNVRLQQYQQQLQTQNNDIAELKKKNKRIIDSTALEIGTLKTKLAATMGKNKCLTEANMTLKTELLQQDGKHQKIVDLLCEANLDTERERKKSEKHQHALTVSHETILQLRHELAMKKEENEHLRATVERGGDSKVDQETVDGIEMLEKHLIKLSEKLRNKNSKIEQLQAVIHRECFQRTKLMDELETLRSR